MGYTLEGGPRDGQYVEELPEGYEPKGIIGGWVGGEGDSPAPRATWGERPKDVYTQQLIDEEYDSWGEGARREMFED